MESKAESQNYKSLCILCFDHLINHLNGEAKHPNFPEEFKDVT
jgi:hypothetical protein